ncbi:MAG: glutaconate CoA-transferase subunit B [Gammaproteobacteria bacterium]|jgi:glutaconate CoA-transferase subunit B
MRKVCVEELLIAQIATRLAGLRHVAVGVSSPIPGAAALLARELSADALRVSILGSRKHTSFTDGSKELFDCAAQGRIDAFFLGGAQIDGAANINLNAIGGYPQSKVRFPGAFGSSYLYFLVPHVFLFTMAHSSRVLVPRVDFISSPGTSAANVYRPGGPRALLTNRCVFDFDRAQKRFTLASVHPGETATSIRENTGFDYEEGQSVVTTAAPSTNTLALIRGPVASAIAEVYPEFAARVFPHACPA